MLDGMLDSMEDKSIAEAVNELATIFKRRILAGEKALALSKNEDGGRYCAEDYRECLGKLGRLVEALSEAMVDLYEEEEIGDFDEFIAKTDAEVEALKKRIAATLEKKAAVETCKGAGI